MFVLGITDGQTSGAALLSDGQIVAAINEERLARIKQARGFPRASIHAVLQMSGVALDEIAMVAVAQTNMEFRDDVAGWNGWFEERQDIEDSHNLFFNVASKFGSLANKIPACKKLYYVMRRPVFEERRRRIADIMRGEFSIHAPVRFFDHHYAHAASAYYTSGFDETLVITMDGGGDGSSSHVYLGRNGKLENLSKVDSYDSLGNYYAYATAICGYKAKRHEGKITGLAAYGNPAYYEMLKTFIDCSEGRTVNKGAVLFGAAVKKMRHILRDDFHKEDLAASIQKLSEDVCREYVRYWMTRTGCRRLALAGGVFANVRINQELHELDGIEEIFIHPGMSDEGLAVGAAMASWATLANLNGITTKPTTPLKNVYLGYEFSERETEIALKESGHCYHYHSNIELEIATLLAAGHVVARFNGRMEYGPRALGNRSILYQPTDPTVNDWLNKDLIRTEFMPFAPSTMSEYAEQCFANVKGAENTARFMTLTFDCTDWMKKHCGGVVHRDGTARPQLVREEDNHSYYRILENFYKLTGLPSVINTSFNMHEEPIVCTPADAVRAFEQGHLDYLAVGNFLLKNPRPLSHLLRPSPKVG
jgi:carbamoyltransferase